MSVDDSDVCNNPASPSYGNRERKASASLPTMSCKRPATAWAADGPAAWAASSAADGAGLRHNGGGITIEEITDDDDCDFAAVSKDADDFMETAQGPRRTPPSAITHAEVTPLSQIPMRTLVDYGRMIPTGVTGFFHATPNGTNYTWVLEQSKRLTNAYKAVGMYPFAAIAGTAGKLSVIAQGMEINWRSPDAMASYYGLTALKNWFIANIAGPMYAREMVDVLFETLLALKSQNGSGVRSFLIEACRQAAINLIVVGNQQVFQGEMEDLVSVAHQAQPCLVLFDRCDNWFMHEYPLWGQAYVSMLESYQAQCRSAAQAAHGFGGGVALRPDKVWTVFSMGLNSTVNPHFYRLVAHATEVCTQPAPAERAAFMTKIVSNVYTDYVGTAHIHLVQAAAADIARLVQQYCGCMTTASLGEMHEMFLTLSNKKRRELAVSGALVPGMLVTALLPTAIEVDAEIRKRRERADQHAAESHRLAPTRK